MPDLIAAFGEQRPGPVLRASYGASGDLSKRIVDGAPYDAALFAGHRPIDALQAKGRIIVSTRRTVARNSLLLVGPQPLGRDADQKPQTDRLSWSTLDRLPAGEMLAMGDPASVPAGMYAKQVLVALGKWQALQGRLVYAGNVAAVLAYARRGEVAAAVVYETDIRGIGDILVLDRARGDWAPTPQVVVAAIDGAKRAHQASVFLDFVASERGAAILAKHGFSSIQR
jgi:molybdate transport system substrate-binding protein